jgi:hypothetical protein
MAFGLNERGQARHDVGALLLQSHEAPKTRVWSDMAVRSPAGRRRLGLPARLAGPPWDPLWCA